MTLRTVHLEDGMAYVRAGATLLYDSEPAEEERETRVKAAAFLEAALGDRPPKPAAGGKDRKRNSAEENRRAPRNGRVHPPVDDRPACRTHERGPLQDLRRDTRLQELARDQLLGQPAQEGQRRKGERGQGECGKSRPFD